LNVDQRRRNCTSRLSEIDRLSSRSRRRIHSGLTALRRAHLLPRGHLIPFLQPYWKYEEIQAGMQWSGADHTHGKSETDDLETHFLDGFGLNGVAVATSSGRTALELALRALREDKIKRNQVVVPAYSCRGLLDPIIQCDLVPVFADIGEDLNLTAATVAPHLCSKTLAVVVVHLGGKYAREVDAVSRVAHQNGAVVIEDLCQALGGRCENQPWGAKAPMAIYSFGLGKNLTATAGGMLVARTGLDFVRREKARLGQENPANVRARFAFIMSAYQRTGFRMLWNLPQMPVSSFESAYSYSRMSSLDAQLVRYQLARMDEIISARQRNATVLIKALRNVSGLSVPGRDGANVRTKFTVLADTAPAAERTRALLLRAGIETETMYTPLHLRDCGSRYSRGALPTTETIYQRAFNLPVRPSLSSQQITYVAEATQRAVLVTTSGEQRTTPS